MLPCIHYSYLFISKVFATCLYFNVFIYKELGSMLILIVFCNVLIDIEFCSMFVNVEFCNMLFSRTSIEDNPKWFMVDVKYERPLNRFISLAELKKIHQEHAKSGGPLQNMALFTRARLSVQPLTQGEARKTFLSKLTWNIICGILLHFMLGFNGKYVNYRQPFKTVFRVVLNNT